MDGNEGIEENQIVKKMTNFKEPHSLTINKQRQSSNQVNGANDDI